MKFISNDFFDEKTRALIKKRNLFYLRNILSMFIAINIFITFFTLGFIPTESMYPTIKKCDLLLLEKNVKNIRRGDVVGFKYQEGQAVVTYVKRVIGLPGEEIEIKHGLVYINGEAIFEDYVFEAPAYECPKTFIPENCYFVLGDNRNNSNDSSEWGVLNSSQITGRVLCILFPPNRIGGVS